MSEELMMKQNKFNNNLKSAPTIMGHNFMRTLNDECLDTHFEVLEAKYAKIPQS